MNSIKRHLSKGRNAEVPQNKARREKPSKGQLSLPIDEAKLYRFQKGNILRILPPEVRELIYIELIPEVEYSIWEPPLVGQNIITALRCDTDLYREICAVRNRTRWFRLSFDREYSVEYDGSEEDLWDEPRKQEFDANIKRFFRGSKTLFNDLHLIKIGFDYDLENPLINRYLENIWTHESFSPAPSQLRCLRIDFGDINRLWMYGPEHILTLDFGRFGRIISSIRERCKNLKTLYIDLFAWHYDYEDLSTEEHESTYTYPLINAVNEAMGVRGKLTRVSTSFGSNIGIVEEQNWFWSLV